LCGRCPLLLSSVCWSGCRFLGPFLYYHCFNIVSELSSVYGKGCLLRCVWISLF
jgi:hypothetical protein